MASCRDCRWWSQALKDTPRDEGACMIARTEPDREGVARPVIADTQMRAVGNGGGIAASLFTRSGFACAAFAAR